MIQNKQIVLTKRPTGIPDETNFEIVETFLLPPMENEVLVKTCYLSMDPYLRNMMNEQDFVGPSAKLGQLFGGLAVGEVIETQIDAYRIGDYVSGAWGWQTYANVSANTLSKLNPNIAPISTALGVLGIAGLTAYFGLTEIGKVKAGETVVVSGAAGSVGMIAGQIAKIIGAKVVGIAGTNEKEKYLKDELGFDEVINYRTSLNLHSSLQQAAPNGVDVYFDNVGGSISDIVLKLINPGARIPLCGQISQYHQQESGIGPRIGMLLVKNAALIQGFSFTQFADRFPEALEQLSHWMKDDRIRYKETIIEGFENTPGAFNSIFIGENIGKLLVKI